MNNKWNKNDELSVYKDGDKVLYQSGSSWDTWIPGKITGSHISRFVQKGYYFESESKDRPVFVQVLNTNKFRLLDFDLLNSLHFIAHHMQYNVTIRTLQIIVAIKRIKLNDLDSTQLLHLTINHGKTSYFEWLLGHNINCCLGRDAKGRSALQSVMMSRRRMTFIKILEKFDTDSNRILNPLVEMLDKSGTSVLHYLVAINVDVLSESFLSGENPNSRLTKAVHEAHRPESLVTQKNAKGQSALVNAKGPKRSRLISLLEKFETEVALCRALEAILHEQVDSHHYVECRALVLDVKWRGIILSRFLRSFLKVTVYRLIERCQFEVAKSLVVAFDVRDDLNVSEDLLYEHEPTLMLQIVKGPRNMGSLDTLLRALSDRDQQQIASQLRSTLYDLLSEWDGASDIVEFIVSKRGDRLTDSVVPNADFVYPSLGAWKDMVLPHYFTANYRRDLVNAYIDQYVNTQFDKQATTRIEMLSWALKELRSPLPPLDHFVISGQLNLLRWVCDTGLVDLSASVSAHAELLDLTQNSTVVKVGSASPFSVAEYLCLLAASHDQLQIFQWIFTQEVTNKTFRVGAEGFNLLHWAVISGSYVVSRWLSDSHSATMDLLLRSGSGLNALHLAIQTNNIRIALHLTRHIPVELRDSTGNDSIHHAIILNHRHSSAQSQLLVAHLRSLRNYGVALKEVCVRPTALTTIWNTIGQAQFIDALYLQCVAFKAGDTTLTQLVEKLEVVDFITLSPKDRVWSLVLLAVRHQVVEFLVEAKKLMRLKMFRGRFGDRECLLLVLESLMTLFTGATRSTSCLRVWRRDVMVALMAERNALKLCDELYTQITKPKSQVTHVEEAFQRLKECLRVADRDHSLYPNSYERYFSDNFDDKESTPLFVHLVLNQRTLILEWILKHKMVPFSSIRRALTLTVSRGKYLAIPKLLTKHLLAYIGENEAPDSAFEVEKSKKALLLDMLVLIVAPPSVRSLGNNRFAIFRCLFIAASMSGVDLKQFASVPLETWIAGESDARMNLVQLAVMSLVRGGSPDNKRILDYLFRLSYLCGDLKASLDGSTEGPPVIVILLKVLFRSLDGLDSEDKTSQDLVHQFADEILPQLTRHGLKVSPHEIEIIDFLRVEVTDHLQSSTYGVLYLLSQFSVYYGISANRYMHFPNTLYASIADVARHHTRISLVIQSFFSKIAASDEQCISDIQRALNWVAVKDFRHRHRSTLLHIAAESDRVEVIRWLAVTLEMDLLAQDDNGLTPLGYAQRIGASDAVEYIRELSASRIVRNFVSSHRLELRESKIKRIQARAATKLLSILRMNVVRRKCSVHLARKREGRSMFRSTWSEVVSLLRTVQSGATIITEVTWSSVKRQHDMHVALESTDREETPEQRHETELMTRLTDIAVQSADCRLDDDITTTTESDEETVDASPSDVPLVSTAAKTPSQPMDTIEFSHAVVQWLEFADGRYKELFTKKMERLAEGDRSYAMSKRLKGCVYPICETKLDSGQRILWTEVKRGVKLSVLVWFVSKHDDVSKMVDHIDKSYLRLSSQPAMLGDTILSLSDDDTLLDPVGNCPLKIYTATRGDIPLLTTADWTPPLRLGAKQQQVQELSGTVLLLGRSGTGKTVCVSDRMTRDRDFMRVIGGVAASQLFVSRSRRLVEFVKNYQLQHTANKNELESVDFLTLDRFVAHMEAVVGQHDSRKRVWSASGRVDFERFSQNMTAVIAQHGLDAVVAWTQIRSFIKGSIEAVLQRSPLSLEQYLDTKEFGLERCRLLTEQRIKAFSIYQSYQDMLTREFLWDDADRVLDLLNRSRLEPLNSCNGKSGDYHKVYVDEVQDNTQAEIVLFFLAAGMNTQSLFLAGDPAQSVVEGVDFRFEDVRSIVYKLSGGAHQIARPIKLLVNYRSHSGILNCAAAVLDKLFVMFPGSAKVLPRDAGLFNGPRPAYCGVCGVDSLLLLLKLDQRMVVVCPDERVAVVERQLSAASIDNLVLGIRAAKGLEFQDIVLYDFFCGIPAADHKAWRSLLTDDQTSIKPYSHPQIESQLKLLYTAITRSCNRLIFAESESMTLCSSFFRWLRSRELAEPFMSSLHSETALMTSDEWRVRGIDFALAAEGSDTVLFLQKAIHCFTLAGDARLTTRAQTQLDIEMLCRDVLSSAGETLSAKKEVEAAGVLLRGLRMGLLEDVKRLCEVIEGVVKEVQIFRVQVAEIMRRIHL